MWLYIGDQDVIHIGQANYSDHQKEYLANREGGGAAPDTGAIDHVCFNCEGIAEFVRRFEAAGVPFSERQAHDQALFQLFLRDPINGIKVELNFAAEEARRAGRKPARTAADARQGAPRRDRLSRCLTSSDQATAVRGAIALPRPLVG